MFPFKAVETKVTGDKAVVKVEGKKGSRTVSETLNLIKEDGEWKLNIGD